jgi:hypothetical protein
VNDKTRPNGTVRSPVPNWFDSLPSEKSTRVDFEAWLQIELIAQFKSFLRHMNYEENLSDSELQDRFDQFLLDNAERLGPRLLCCDAVRERVIHWHEGHADGGRRSERFYKALQRHFDVTQGSKKGTLQIIDYSSRKKIVMEMQSLQQYLQGCASARRQRCSWSDVRTEIEIAPAKYPFLLQNLLSLEQFFGDNPDTLPAFADRESHLTAAEVVNQFFGWATNRDPQSARQAISELGR